MSNPEKWHSTEDYAALFPEMVAAIKKLNDAEEASVEAFRKQTQKEIDDIFEEMEAVA